MKSPYRFLFPLLLLGLAPIPFGGCMSTDEEARINIPDDTGIVYDPFPAPIGNAMLALNDEPTSLFRYVEMDGQGFSRTIVPDFPLYIRRRGPDTYGYAFMDSTRGLLLEYLRPGDGHAGSVAITRPGIYLVGNFRDTLDSRATRPTLWLPDSARVGETWSLGGGRTMEIMEPRVLYLTENLMMAPSTDAPVARGFQSHPAVRFRETCGDTVTIYHFRRGLGLLGLERSVGGSLRAAGTLRSIRRLVRRP